MTGRRMPWQRQRRPLITHPKRPEGQPMTTVTTIRHLTVATDRDAQTIPADVLAELEQILAQRFSGIR
jgi:hypothetical protein